MLEAINTAPDLDQLKAHYTSAIKLTAEHYHKQLEEAKDKRKTELSTPLQKAA
jgi:hypothetical protein